MFAYIERYSLLHRRNPTIKLAVVAVLTVVVCLSYYPVLPILTFLLAFVATWLCGRIPLAKLLRHLALFLFVSAMFMVSMLILRGLDVEDDIALQFLVFRWSERDIVHSVTLGFRILALVTMSMSFVITTRPSDLVLSLIMQCRVSVVHGYAAMAAYRFLPELQNHVDAIHLAQEIRGIPWNKGVLSRFSSPFRVIVPLMCVAARRGERVACAMQARGLGRGEQRTYYTNIEVNGGDWAFLVITCAGYVALSLVLAHFGLFRFSFASIM